MPTLDSPTLDTVFFDYDRKPRSRHPMTCLAIYGKGGIGKSTTARTWRSRLRRTAAG